MQDEVRRVQGQTKQYQEPKTGTIVRVDPSGEFGFLESTDGEEIYFHRNSVLHKGFAHLGVGSRVTYAEETGDKGAQASTGRLKASTACALDPARQRNAPAPHPIDENQN